MGAHLIDGEFQSDKYPTTPRGKVPLSVKDPTAQDLLWEYAQRWRQIDGEFAADLETALRDAGFSLEQSSISRMTAELDRLRTLIDTPEIRDFAAAVEREAAHQRHRWGDGHDESKTLHDWIAVYVHLMGKMIAADWQGDAEKCAHHIVTVAAVAANMHRLLTARMRALAEAAP